jgi:hypothetical protein
MVSQYNRIVLRGCLPSSFATRDTVMVEVLKAFVRICLTCLICLLIRNTSWSAARATLTASTESMRTVTKAKDRSIGESAVAPVARLRSAFLLRGAQRYPDLDTNPVEQLQQHFAAVLHVLALDTEKSLQLALERLESYHGSAFGNAERTTWLRHLRRERMINLARLQAYQLRGVFPHNEHARALPVFVDAHNNACAVGYLMRASGWDKAVRHVQQRNNYVYVLDIHSGPVLEWILQSGLTREEAALIQPAYAPPPPGYVNLQYNPADGHLWLDTGDMLITSIEIKSKSGLFVGPQPAQVQFAFDVYNPYKLFLFRPEGMGSQDFGPAMPAGVSPDSIREDLSVQGSVLPSGYLEGWCFNSSAPCVPEPCGMALMAVGIVGAMARHRRFNSALAKPRVPRATGFASAPPLPPCATGFASGPVENTVIVRVADDALLLRNAPHARLIPCPANRRRRNHLKKSTSKSDMSAWSGARCLTRRVSIADAGKICQS